MANISGGGKSTDNANTIYADQIFANVADFTYLNVQQNAVVNNLTVTGTTNISGSVSLTNINCQTLTASDFVKAKNDTNEYALLQTTSSTAPDPNQCILSSSAGSAGLDLITLGSGKKIQLISTECHMVAGYSIFPTLPVGISLFSNTLIALDSITQTTIRATTTASMTCNLGLTLTGGTVAALSSGSGALTLTGGNTATFRTTAGQLLIQSGANVFIDALTEARLFGAETVLISTGTLGAATLTIRGHRETSLVSLVSSLTLTGATTASLTSTSGALTLSAGSSGSFSTTTSLSLTGGTTASLSATVGALTLTGGTTASLSSTLGALTLTGGTTASLSSTSNCSISASAGDVTISASQVGTVGGVIALSSLSPFGTTTNGITLTTGVGGIALTTTAGLISLTTGVGGIAFSVLGGAISMATALSSIGIGALGGISLRSINTVQVVSDGGSSTGGIYLDTTASNGSGAGYNWRFPATAGSAGQVLTSQGPSLAQTWSTALAADVNGNVSANNFFGNLLNVSTNGTTQLTVASPYYINVNATGGAVQLDLPDATTLPAGKAVIYFVNCNGTSTVNVKRFGSGTVESLAQGAACMFELLDNSTSAGTWDSHSYLPSTMIADNTSFVVSQPLMTTNAISSKQTATETALSCYPLTANTEASIRFNSQITKTGAYWTLGQNVAAAGSDSFALYSSTLVGRALTIDNAGRATFVNSITAATTSTAAVSLMATFSAGGTNLGPQETHIAFGNVQSPATFGRHIVQKYVAVGANSPNNYYELGWDSYVGAAPYTGFWRAYGRGVTVQSGAVQVDYYNFTPTITLSYVLASFLSTNLSTTDPASEVLMNFGRTNSADDCLQFIWKGNLRKGYFSIFAGTSVELSTTLISFNRPLVCNIAGTASPIAFQTLVPSLSTGNNVSIQFGTAASTNNSAVMYFKNTGGSGSASNQLILGVSGTDFLLMSGLVSQFNTAISCKTTSGNNPLSCYPASANTECAILFNSQVTNTGARWVVGQNVASSGADTFAIYSTSAGARIMTMATTKTDFNCVVTAKGADTIECYPATQNAQSAVMFHTQITNTGARWILGQNVGASGTDRFALYSTTLGANAMYFNNAGRLFVKNTIQSIDNNFYLVAPNVNNGQIGIESGSLQNGGVYLNAQYSGTYSALPAFGRGSTNIGSSDLGNCLFVGANQEKFIAASVSANGIITVSCTSSNTQYMTFYEINGTTRQPTTAKGSITNTVGGVSYNVSSDYRLKENVQPMPSVLPMITALQPKTYSWIADPEQGLYHGFIAHEVQAVLPEAVMGQKDAVDEYDKPMLQQMDYSKLTPILTKAIQELLEKITLLESRIAVLESQ